MSLELSDEATVRDVIAEAVRLGGEPLRRVLWRSDGRLEDSVMIAIDGDVLDREQLDARLPVTGDAEVSLFLIRPVFGGSDHAGRRSCD